MITSTVIKVSTAKLNLDMATPLEIGALLA